MKRAIALVSWSMLMIAVLAPQAAAQKGQLVVGFSAYSAAFMPAFVADRSGYFSQESLSVKLIFFQSGVQLAQSLISGDTQIDMGSAPELNRLTLYSRSAKKINCGAGFFQHGAS